MSRRKQGRPQQRRTLDARKFLLFFLSDSIFVFIILVFKIYGHRGLCQICVLTTGDKVTYVLCIML